jgi:two-component system CAI-1 autoinducer sensor kinase/phosphatase CqsS
VRIIFLKNWLLRRHPLIGIFSPLEPILHLSPWRMRLLGFALMLGHPLYGWVWTYLIPMPYENLWLRIILSVLGAVFLLPFINYYIDSFRTRLLISLIIWIQLPLFTSWMYFCNSGNYVFLSVMCTITIIYYHFTDWRIATIGMITAIGFSWFLYSIIFLKALNIFLFDPASLVVISFSWLCAVLLGVSSANLRRERLAHTLTTINILSNDLRIPLNAVSILKNDLQHEAVNHSENIRPFKIKKIAQQLQILVDSMNFQIESQIANAKLFKLPLYSQCISAKKLVLDMFNKYSFESNIQRECLQIIIHEDFIFRASYSEFLQVLKNLLKNALTSLLAADCSFVYGVVCIEVGCYKGRGRIVITDAGMGMNPQIKAKIFKLFYSLNQNRSHGLGLSFCQYVVSRAGGHITVMSEYAIGATFTIELPILKITV